MNLSELVIVLVLALLLVSMFGGEIKGYAENPMPKSPNPFKIREGVGGPDQDL